MKVFAETPERLRREYLCKLESSAPLPQEYRSKGDFYFDGHRLSSLYRTLTLNALRLTNGIHNRFFFAKILKSTLNQKVTS